MLGEGVRVLEHAVVGKQPSLGARSTAKREPLPPAVIGDGTVVSTGAIVFAGLAIGARVHRRRPVVHPRARRARRRLRPRSRLADRERHDGRRAARASRPDAYVTAYSTLEEDVFIAPCVVTTNDNFMGRTEKRKELMKGPTIRRGARDRRRGDPLPRRRDRRGGVRRRRRGRDEGRPAAGRRRRLPGARPARRRPGRAQGERRLTREREVVLHGLGRPRRPPSPRGSTCRRRADAEGEPRLARPPAASRRARDAIARRARRRARVPGAHSCSRTFACGRRRQPREQPLARARGGRGRRRGCRPSSRATRRPSAAARGSVCAHGPASSFGSYRSGRGSGSVEVSRVERACDVERPPAGQRVATGRRTRRSRRACDASSALRSMRYADLVGRAARVDRRGAARRQRDTCGAANDVPIASRSSSGPQSE